ncbi:phosphate acyltransferase PlsX [Carboxydochorda subterranea]|uniref:Phosphate acyltransferase n=1 Tax=Carboxydichorda subterranea TaxID=3109565 RepID=A0ABZ1C009_9FIRM|nr:phosphate acyltransferase PlsX [Limnochorda sp. L945t]WRP18416.1 phosphate acyltransferase PlsX [Limnochorda sp. L945t]
MALVVDAMGGDDAPRSPVRGALQAAADVPGPIELVGLPTAIEPLLQGAASGERIRVVAATEQIGMDEHPVEAVRKKRDASLVVAARRVKELGAEGALVSAGSTGAVLAASLLHIGRIPGVERPAIAIVLPLFTGPVVLLDGGANVDCRPSHLVQFGVLGRVFARVVLGIPEARVGLLNIGEEETKGNELTIAVHPLMRRHVPGFVGNVEGKDVFAGACDVVVCDGFVGNVLLKSIEGFAAALLGEIKRAAAASVKGKLGGWLLKGALSSLRARLDYRSYGGAFLIGVRGVVVVAHGRSDEVAMANAVRLAHRGVRGDLVASIGEAIQRLPEEVSSHAGS